MSCPTMGRRNRKKAQRARKRQAAVRTAADASTRGDGDTLPRTTSLSDEMRAYLESLGLRQPSEGDGGPCFTLPDDLEARVTQAGLEAVSRQCVQCGAPWSKLACGTCQHGLVGVFCCTERRDKATRKGGLHGSQACLHARAQRDKAHAELEHAALAVPRSNTQPPRQSDDLVYQQQRRIRLARIARQPRVVHGCYRSLAETALAAGDSQSAVDYLLKAVAVARDMGSLDEMSVLYAKLSSALRRSGQPEAAVAVSMVGSLARAAGGSGWPLLMELGRRYECAPRCTAVSASLDGCVGVKQLSTGRRAWSRRDSIPHCGRRCYPRRSNAVHRSSSGTVCCVASPELATSGAGCTGHCARCSRPAFRGG